MQGKVGSSGRRRAGEGRPGGPQAFTVRQVGREAGRKPLASAEFCGRGKAVGWALQMRVCVPRGRVLLS